MKAECLPTSEMVALEIEEGMLPKTNRKDMVIEWENINYQVPVVIDKVSTDKILLHSMSGKAEPSKLLGIMGTSGLFL